MAQLYMGGTRDLLLVLAHLDVQLDGLRRPDFSVALWVQAIGAWHEHPHAHLHLLPIAGASKPDPTILNVWPPPREALVPLGPCCCYPSAHGCMEETSLTEATREAAGCRGMVGGEGRSRESADPVLPD